MESPRVHAGEDVNNEYPQVRVAVTSRIIGYNPERLRDAGFVHMTLQELEPEQVERFIQQ
ncbi:MAG: hypothetical protein SW833_12970 [Cyanobacteriota bacterium]|nr:hypothetical protein [Cyanobacteriota bacterium]